VSTTAERVSAPLQPVPGPSPSRWSVLELVPPLAVVLLGAVLLAPGHGLWFDELFTAEVGRRSYAELFTAIAEGRGTTSYLVDRPAVVQRALLRRGARLDVAPGARRGHLAAGAVAAGHRRRAGPW
jgi:hypothetical protein